MSTIFIQTDWPVHERKVIQRRKRVLWVVLSWMLFMLTFTAIVQRAISRLVFQAILTDCIGWGITAGLVVWYALRYRPERKRMALLSGLFVALVLFIVNIVPKWSLPAWPPADADITPMLYWGLWHLVFLGGVLWIMRRYPREMRAIGLEFTHWRRDLLVGILSGGMLSGHFLFSVAFTGAGSLHFPPLPYGVWQMSFECVATLLTELLFRGVIYRYLESECHWDYWAAAPLSALATVSVFLVKVRWTSDIIVTAGVLFYVIVLSLISASLYRWTRSLWPAYIAALVFHFTAMLR